METHLRKIIRTRNNHEMGLFSDSLMTNLHLIKYNEATASSVFSFDVTKDLCNDYDTLHGGAQATAIDILSSILLSHLHPVPSVTTDLHVSCVSPAPLGSTVWCVCKAEKYGGALQFSSCDLHREVVVEETGTEEDRGGRPPTNRTRRVLVAKGLHTKYVVKNRARGFGGGKRRSNL